VDAGRHGLAGLRIEERLTDQAQDELLRCTSSTGR
jgi:hypothetical protein